MNVDEQISAILKERAPDVPPNPQAWDRISAGGRRSRSGRYVGAAAAAAVGVAAVAIGAVTVTGLGERWGISRPDTSRTKGSSSFSGQVVFGSKGVVKVKTFQTGPTGSSWSLNIVGIAPPETEVDYVDVTSDGTVLFAASHATCASGIYSAAMPSSAGGPQARPLDPGGVTTLVAPQPGLGLRMPTVSNGRLAFIRSECTRRGDGALETRNIELVVRDIASGQERVIGPAIAHEFSRLSWVANRYLVFTSFMGPDGLVAYDTTSDRSPLIPPAADDCRWGSATARAQHAEIAAVEVCGDSSRSRVVTYAITGDRLERRAELFTVRGEIDSLDYDAAGTRLLYSVGGRISVRDDAGAVTRIDLGSGAHSPVW